MVYLIAAALAVAVTSLVTSCYGIWALNRLPQSGLEGELKRLAMLADDSHSTLMEHSRTLAEVRETVPVIRGEVAEALTRVDSRFNAARAAEERTRRIASKAADEEDRDETLSEEEFLALRASSAPEEPDSHQLTWPDMERIAFERRNERRR